MHVKHAFGICKKTVAKNHNAICCDKCNQWVHITCNKITKYCFIKTSKGQVTMVLQAVNWKEIPFSNMTDIQLNRLMKERYLISQKLISEQDQILFSDKNFSFATNDYWMLEKFSKFIDNKFPSHLHLHTNISTLSYHTDDLPSFILSCKKRPRIIGIPECRLRANQQSLSNISL